VPPPALSASPGLLLVAPCRCPNGPPAQPRCIAILPETLWRWLAPARHRGC